jgi:hypothetical protein
MRRYGRFESDAAELFARLICSRDPRSYVAHQFGASRTAAAHAVSKMMRGGSRPGGTTALLSL